MQKPLKNNTLILREIAAKNLATPEAIEEFCRVENAIFVSAVEVKPGLFDVEIIPLSTNKKAG